VVVPARAEDGEIDVIEAVPRRIPGDAGDADAAAFERSLNVAVALRDVRPREAGDESPARWRHAKAVCHPGRAEARGRAEGRAGTMTEKGSSTARRRAGWRGWLAIAIDPPGGAIVSWMISSHDGAMPAARRRENGGP